MRFQVKDGQVAALSSSPPAHRGGGLSHFLGGMACHGSSLSAPQPDSWIHNILDMNSLQRCCLTWQGNELGASPAHTYPTPKTPKEKLSPEKGRKKKPERQSDS